MRNRIGVGAFFSGMVARLVKSLAGLALRQRYQIDCFRADGSLKWSHTFNNLVTSEGLNDWLNKYWNGNLYSAAHYVGFTDSAPTVAAGDTMAAHGGWAEVVAYTESVRQQLNMGTAASASIDNSSNKAVISCNANGTVIGGLFIATSSTKGGSAGLLIAVGAFTGGDKTVDNGESLTVTVTSTIASV